MPIGRSEYELRTLARRVEAARLALSLKDGECGPNNQVPKGKISQRLMPGQYHVPKTNTTLRRIKEMATFPNDLLNRITISADGIFAIACSQVLEEAFGEFNLTL